MDTDDLYNNARILDITIGGFDEFEVEEELEETIKEGESKKESQELENMGLHETPTNSNREMELLDEFRYKLLEDRGETLGESTLFRDLKDLKEKSLEKKKARRLKKLKVKFQDRVQLSPFERSCCKCSKKENSANCQNLINDASRITQDSSQIDQESSLNYKCNGNPKCRPVAKMSSIDLYGCIIPKELMKF